MADFPNVDLTITDPQFDAADALPAADFAALIHSADTVAPNVTYVAPTTIAPSGNVVVDVADPSGLKVVVIRALFPTDGHSEVLAEGNTILGGYSGTVTPITNGNRYIIARTGGWPEATMTVTTLATDPYNSVSASQTYTIDPAPPPVVSDVTPPVVSNFSPAQGTALAPSDAVTFDVADETELRRTIIAVALSTGEQELAYDGVAFTARYAGSKRTTLIADESYRFSLVRTGGWPAGATITVRVFAADAAGNIES